MALKASTVSSFIFPFLTSFSILTNSAGRRVGGSRTESRRVLQRGEKHGCGRRELTFFSLPVDLSKLHVELYHGVPGRRLEGVELWPVGVWDGWQLEKVSGEDELRVGRSVGSKSTSHHDH